VQAKLPRKPFKSVEDKSLAPLDLIHSDLCEINGILMRAAKKYFIILIDDATRYCQLYLVKTKGEALNCFKIYKAEVENQLENKIKRVRSDRGVEYLSNEFGEYCTEHGIILETTAPYSPQSNGVAQRKNQTLRDLVNAMLDSSGLSKSWWGEAILATCFVLNRVPSAKGDKTPYEGWKGRKPTLGFLRAWVV
jgi:transposase InsO family protein